MHSLFRVFPEGALGSVAASSKHVLGFLLEKERLEVHSYCLNFGAVRFQLQCLLSFLQTSRPPL